MLQRASNFSMSMPDSKQKEPNLAAFQDFLAMNDKLTSRMINSYKLPHNLYDGLQVFQSLRLNSVKAKFAQSFKKISSQLHKNNSST